VVVPPAYGLKIGIAPGPGLVRARDDAVFTQVPNRDMTRSVIVILALVLTAGVSDTEAQTLRGSPSKMQRQNAVARQHDYNFLRTTAEVRRFVDLGLLVPVKGNANYTLASVSFPYARPAVLTFVERLGAQYRSACGERLVITSLTRPVQNQPRNASPLSVHPAGMAVDLRVPSNRRCRDWLESTLLSLDRQGVVSAIRENSPPHYHVAVFPTPYLQYVSRVVGGTAVASTAPTPARTGASTASASAPRALAAAPVIDSSADMGQGTTETAAVRSIRVNRGDSLWTIARRTGTTVDDIKALNNLRSSTIQPGQVLTVPGR
jgi:hypothetical protein